MERKKVHAWRVAANRLGVRSLLASALEKGTRKSGDQSMKRRVKMLCEEE